MLDSVGLVHMNGRVYDPLVGRFLSADPIIQTISVSQAINPFYYVMERCPDTRPSWTMEGDQHVSQSPTHMSGIGSSSISQFMCEHA